MAAAYIPAEQNKLAIQVIRTGLEAVKAGLRDNPKDAELLLLGAMLDGQWLLINRWRFFYNGRRALQRLSQAEQIDPQHPHVTLLRGTAKIILPGILGGNRQEAREMFEHALDRVDPLINEGGLSFRETRLCTNRNGRPIWGQVDLLNWLGRAHAALQDHDRAQLAYAEAHARSPDNHWVELAIQGHGYQWVSDEESTTNETGPTSHRPPPD
ncbi:MAG: hypothetical protein AAF541_15650 [Pseudomonadota bacterium]